MFDFSLAELMLAGVVALLVLGPERLPKVARTAGRWVAKIQNMAAGIKHELAQRADYADLMKAKQEFEQAAQEIREEVRDTANRLHENAETIRREVDNIETAAADSLSDTAASERALSEEGTLPAWERLPEQHTPADFGVDDSGRPLYLPTVPPMQAKSLRKQALARKHDLRPRHRPVPKLRVRNRR